MSSAEKTAVEDFRRDVVEPSMTKLVIIDFWAEWCGPCKALTPVLEKVAADYAGKDVVLAKVDTDKNRFIAEQFQIKSIPTVYAMFQGQLVADLTGERTESALKAKLDTLLKQLPLASEADDGAAEIEPLIAMAEDILESGDAGRALSIFEQLIDMAADDPRIVSGRIRALVAAKRYDEAKALIEGLPPEIADGPGITRARSAIDLAETAHPVEDLSALRKQVIDNPGDLDARYRLAGGQMAADDRDGAAENLLGIIAVDRDWNEGAARTQLLRLFDVVGLEDSWVSAQRRRLSAILFG